MSIGRIKQNLDRARKEKDELKREVKKLTSVKPQVDENTRAIKELKKLLNVKNRGDTKIDDMEETLEVFEDRISLCEDSVKTVKTVSDSINDMLKHSSATTDFTKADLKRVKKLEIAMEAFGDLSFKIRNKEKRLRVIEKAVGIGAKKGKYDGMFKQTVSHIDGVRKDFRKTLDGVSGDLKSFDSRIKALEGRVEKKGRRGKTVSKDLERVVEANSREIDDLHEDIKNLREDMTSEFNTLIDEYEKRFALIKKRVKI